MTVIRCQREQAGDSTRVNRRAIQALYTRRACWWCARQARYRYTVHVTRIRWDNSAVHATRQSCGSNIGAYASATRTLLRSRCHHAINGYMRAKRWVIGYMRTRAVRCQRVLRRCAATQHEFFTHDPQHMLYVVTQCRLRRAVAGVSTAQARMKMMRRLFVTARR